MAHTVEPDWKMIEPAGLPPPGATAATEATKVAGSQAATGSAGPVRVVAVAAGATLTPPASVAALEG